MIRRPPRSTLFPSNRIALVEAPKTAVYGTLYFGLPETSDQYLWLAVYNKSSFSLDKVRPLQGRFVDVFPDLSKDGGTFREWESKAKDFEKQLPGTQFNMYDFLEMEAPQADRVKGEDIADYLIKLDWKDFRSREVKKEASAPLQVEPLETDPLQLEIDQLEKYFNRIKLPSEPVDVRSDKFIHTICEPERFAKGAIRAVRSGKYDTEYFITVLKGLKDAIDIINNDGTDIDDSVGYQKLTEILTK